jgi:hypothetical protein
VTRTEDPSTPEDESGHVTNVTSKTGPTSGLRGTPPVPEHDGDTAEDPSTPECGATDDYADLAMVGDFQPRDQDEPEGETSLAHLEEITALQDDYENAESEALKAITDQPALISQTADKLTAYLANIADSGDASEFEDQVSS